MRYNKELKKGDVVKLKTNGIKMCIWKIIDDNKAVCEYWNCLTCNFERRVCPTKRLIFIRN